MNMKELETDSDDEQVGYENRYNVQIFVKRRTTVTSKYFWIVFFLITNFYTNLCASVHAFLGTKGD
jgi:hypothetical protein